MDRGDLLNGRRCLLAVVVILVTRPVIATEYFFWRDGAGNTGYSDRPTRGAVSRSVDPGYTFYDVRFVYDGDTIRLDNGDRVRLLGINTPEVERRDKPGEPGGEAAKLWLAKRLEDTRVRLQADVQGKDRYGRSLAHCFTESGEHLNLSLVEQGLAAVNIHPPNLAFADVLVAAQQRARKTRLGIWGNPAYTPVPIEDLAGRSRGWRRLYGTPVRVRRGRKFHRLIFSEHVDVRIPLANLSLFEDLRRYIGKPLEIMGWPSRRKKRYSILVRHPSAMVDRSRAE